MRARAIIEVLVLLVVAWLSLASSEDDEGGGGAPTPEADTWTPPAGTRCSASPDCPGYLPSDRCAAQEACVGGVCAPVPAVSCDGISASACQVGQCNADNGQCYLAARPDGAFCDDGNACTFGDACQAGLCSGGMQVDCGAAAPCYSVGCQPAAGCVTTPLADLTPCDDGDACTTGEACSMGSCIGQMAPCDDGDPCTADGCAVNQGCVHSPLPSSTVCDDGNPCTADDRCQPAGCQGQPLNGTACGGSACAEVGLCSTGVCVPGPTFPDGTPCDDGSLCTTDTTCEAGMCAGGEPVTCSGGGPCHVAVCYPQLGCSLQETPDKPCDPGLPCVATGICGGAGCQVQTYQPPGSVCDDGGPCTSAGTCSDQGSCQPGEALSGVPCDDDDVCTAGETCVQGQCGGGAPIDCDDGNPCTLDACHPTLGCETIYLSGEPCDDGDPCTSADACHAGACWGAPDPLAPGCPLEASCLDLADDEGDGLTDCAAPGCLATEPACHAARPVPEVIDFDGPVPGFGAVNVVGEGATWAVEAPPGAPGQTGAALSFTDGAGSSPGDVSTLPSLEARVTLCCWATPPGTMLYASFAEYLDWDPDAVAIERRLEWFEVVADGVFDGGGSVALPMDLQGTWRRETTQLLMTGTVGFTLVVRYASAGATGAPGLGWFVDDLVIATEHCHDDLDNDGDGAVDCDDPDCAGTPLCP